MGRDNPSRSVNSEEIPFLGGSAPPSDNLRKWTLITCVLLCVCIVLSVAVIVLASTSGRSDDGDDCSSKDEVSTDIEPDSVFHDLTLDEYAAVKSFLMSDPSLKLKEIDVATAKDNFIFGIEHYLPKKDEVISYWGNQRSAKPVRFARAILQLGAEAIPQMREYLVYPLPNPTTKSELILHGRQTPIPYSRRPFSSMDFASMDVVARQVSEKAYSILIESFGIAHHNCSLAKDCLTIIIMGMPGSLKNGSRQSWVNTLIRYEGIFLYPLPFLILVDHLDADANKWKVLKVYYNDQVFDSVEELVQNYQAGTIKKIKVPKPSKQTLLRATSRRRGSPFFDSTTPRRGPAPVEPNGLRFTVRGNRVRYGAWNMEFGTRSSGGISLYNVRFRQELISYELGLQDAVAFYSGESPKVANSQYLDTSWGLGSSMYELTRGVDCPENSVFLDFHILWGTSQPAIKRNSICVFEWNAGIPSRRHIENLPGSFYYSGTADNALVIRSIITPFNYDYIADFIFHQNGVVEVKVSTAGYIQPGFWLDNERPYGFPIFNSMFGPLHDHFVLFKADIDVVEAKSNSFSSYDIVTKNESYPFDGAYPFRIKKNVVKNKRSTEKEALIRYDFDKPKAFTIENELKASSTGVPRGFRLDSKMMVKNLYPDDNVVTNMAQWTKYQLAVTKYKDDERFGGSLYNQYGGAPLFEFDSFHEDNENIEGEDLVAWIVVGGMHIPVPEDIPTTFSTGNHYTFVLRPFGFFDEDPSTTSKDGVFVKRKQNGAITVDTNGLPASGSCIPQKREFGVEL